MWRVNPINPSNGIVFERFDAIYNIARTMKGCHVYYLCKEDGCLYGCNEDYFCIRVVTLNTDIVPIPSSLVFKLLTIDQKVVQHYRSFIFYPDNPWMMVPTDTLPYHGSYKCLYSEECWEVYNQNNEKVDYIDLLGVDTNEGVKGIYVNNIVEMVNSMKRLQLYLGESQFFGNQEQNPLIQEVFANKASEGCKYMRLTGINGKNYGFMLFKNLFNMNKADNLTIVIRDRLDNPTLYQATFITSKKKSPVPDVLPQYLEKTYVMFLNI